MKNLVLALSFLPLFVNAQYNRGLIPRNSPEKMVSQKVGYTDVKLHWSSPSVKGRKIWGELVDYNEIWRAGANGASTVEFSGDVTINNTKITKGKYAFFVIPSEFSKWTVVLNSDHEQWGTYNYDKSKDVLRFETLPIKRSNISEEVTMRINQHSFMHGSLTFSWEYIDLEIPFETDFLNELKSAVERESEAAVDNAKFAPYLQGAAYLEEINMNLDWAKTWIEQAEKMFKKVKDWDEKYMAKDFVEAHILWTKAKILARSGDYKEAAKLAQQLVDFKEGAKFYKRGSNKAKVDEKLKEWGEKSK